MMTLSDWGRVQVSADFFNNAPDSIKMRCRERGLFRLFVDLCVLINVGHPPPLFFSVSFDSFSFFSEMSIILGNIDRNDFRQGQWQRPDVLGQPLECDGDGALHNMAARTVRVSHDTA